MIDKSRIVYASGFTWKKSKKFPYPMIREVDLEDSLKELMPKLNKKARKGWVEYVGVIHIEDVRAIIKRHFAKLNKGEQK